MKDTDYNMIYKMIESLTTDVPYPIANLANISAVLYEFIPGVSWAGFYMITDDLLVLGPFQGKAACIKIERGKGVCGSAWALDQTQIVADVHLFPGHIPCDSASNSEIVVPIHKNGEVIGVIDLDSTHFDNFHENDARGLEKIAELISTFEL